MQKKKLNFLKEYPNTDYAIDLRFKYDLIFNQLAAKRTFFIAKHYISTQKWIPAINRLKIIVKDYQKTIFVEEALHRLVEIHYHLGLRKKLINMQRFLGYNYNSSEWFEQSLKFLIKIIQFQKNKKNEKK